MTDIYLSAALQDLILEAFHETVVYPEMTVKTVSFTAGGVNAFGAWAEITDSGAVTLSSLATSDMHISSVLIESTDTVDKMYLLEISYGAGKVNVHRQRFGSGAKFIAPAQQVRVRAGHILAGKIIYYRMACEAAGSIATASIRYHLH